MQPRFARFTSFTSVACALAAFDAACATSVDTSGGEESADGGITPDARCAGAACVPATADADRDGFDAPTDCDDGDPAVHPGAAETCNGKDDDCNGTVDEGFDKDGDGFFACAAGARPADCDDGSASVHPGMAEVCNTIDDDCNGAIDEGFDRDGDGYFVCAHGAVAVDCNDADPAVHPGAAEACNERDDDCNGKIDDKVGQPALNDGFLPTPNAHWTHAGSADLNGAAQGWSQLTPDSGSQAGALWWNAPYTFDHFDMTVTFLIQAKSGADGMAFAWVPGSNVSAVGGAGGGYGFTGLGGGYAVVIDTYQNSGEPAAPFLAVVDTRGTHLTRAALPNVRDGQGHALRVALEAATVSAWVDGAAYVTGLALPAYLPFAGHWGFTASTGSSSERHSVTGISMTFPDGQGCVP